MKNFIFVLFVIVFCNGAAAQICERNPGLREALEQQLGKPCNEITPNDLLVVKQLKYRTSYAITKYLFTSEGPEWDLRGANNFSGLKNLENLEVSLQSDFSPVILKSAFKGLGRLKSLTINIIEVGNGLIAGFAHKDIFCALPTDTKITFRVYPSSDVKIFSWYFLSGALNCLSDDQLAYVPAKYYKFE